MIGTDKDWKNLVRNIANGSANNRDSILEAAAYLWNSYNWNRLKETSHGRFLREVHNEVPDLTLRIVYRKEVLESREVVSDLLKRLNPFYILGIAVISITLTMVTLFKLG